MHFKLTPLHLGIYVLFMIEKILLGNHSDSALLSFDGYIIILTFAEIAILNNRVNKHSMVVKTLKVNLF